MLDGEVQQRRSEESICLELLILEKQFILIKGTMSQGHHLNAWINTSIFKQLRRSRQFLCSILCDFPFHSAEKNKLISITAQFFSFVTERNKILYPKKAKFIFFTLRYFLRLFKDSWQRMFAWDHKNIGQCKVIVQTVVLIQTIYILVYSSVLCIFKQARYFGNMVPGVPLSSL